MCPSLLCQFARQDFPKQVIAKILEPIIADQYVISVRCTPHIDPYVKLCRLIAPLFG
jgi:hypothetical protein